MYSRSPERFPRQRAPTRALDGDGRLRELVAKRVERAEELVDRRRELAVGPVAAVGRQVQPEQRVQHVAGQVERERLLEADDRAEIAAGARRAELLERRRSRPST